MSRALRDALGCFATGVTVVTTTDPDSGVDLGLTCSSFSAVSLQPPLVLWSLRHEAECRAAFTRAGGFTVSVLAAEQQALAMRFADGEQHERFASLALQRAASGRRQVPDCVAWFDCTTVNIVEAGDHDIFIGQVEEFSRRYASGLVFAQSRFGCVQHES